MQAVKKSYLELEAGNVWSPEKSESEQTGLSLGVAELQKARAWHLRGLWVGSQPLQGEAGQGMRI